MTHLQQQANSLRDLLIIRAANKNVIERFNGTLGTALGYKVRRGRRTTTAAVLVFVPRKVRMREGDAGAVLRVLRAVDPSNDAIELWCHTDVIVSRRSRYVGEPPKLSETNENIVEQLREQQPLCGGVQIGGKFADGNQYVGTVACAVVSRDAEAVVGVLTNDHVAATVDGKVYQPIGEQADSFIGTLEKTIGLVADEQHYDNLIDEPHASIHIDAAFVRTKDGVTPVAGVLLPDKHGELQSTSLGDNYQLNIGSMDVIGLRVASIGRTQGYQTGEIYAYAFEYDDSHHHSVYTDYLVASDDSDVAQFSAPGDSGKLIFTLEDDGSAPRPVALLWGGWPQSLRGSRLEDWTYAADIGSVLDELEVDILRGQVPRPTIVSSTSSGIGFDSKFVRGATLPILDDVLSRQAINGGEKFDHVHFSVVMHARRRLAIYVAANLDYSQRQVVSRSNRWRSETGLTESQQYTARDYRAPYQKGHLAMRAALAWGDKAQAQAASDDSFVWSNCAPQHKDFHQDEWVAVEQHVWRRTNEGPISLYIGPVLADDDVPYGRLLVPRKFWKVVVFEKGGALRAVAFVMDQSELWSVEQDEPPHFYQTTVAHVESLTHLRFPDAVRNADTLLGGVTPSSATIRTVCLDARPTAGLCRAAGTVDEDESSFFYGIPIRQLNEIVLGDVNDATEVALVKTSRKRKEHSKKHKDSKKHKEDNSFHHN
mmetsp:Transcript_22878/g.38889  ORF Transcript_22878/g.38889 Transcript_22878/m.38889 type:complete len:710 (+) Transcript_22878:61-2190(+)